MPNIKAAVKWTRQTQTRTTRNLDTKTRLKTLFKKAATAQDAQVTREVEGEFDKAAKRGVIHPNKAARKKSRLAKAARAAATAPPKAEKPAKSGAKTAKTTKKTAK